MTEQPNRPATPVTAAEAEADEATGSGDRHVRGMARGGGLNLVGALLSQAAVFLIMLLLARVLGVREVGRYAQCYAVLSLFGLLSLSGFRAGLTRFVAVHLADDDAPALRGTIRLGLGVSVGSAVLLATGLAAAAPWLAEQLNDPGLTTGLRLVALTLPATTICEAALAATRGWRTQRPFTYIGQLYEPGTRLLVTVLALATGAGLTGAFWALAVAGWSAALLALVALARLLRRVEPARPVYRPRQLFGFSTVSWASSLSSTGLIWMDTLLLGFFANPEIGVYNVATRLVTVAIFVLAPINASFGPYIAYLYHQGSLPDVRRVYTVATGWVVRLSLPAFVALLILPGDLLRVFDGSIATGATVTVVLALGQLVNAATGPCGTVLNMSGRVALNMADNVAALVINVLLNLWLIPAYGIVGSAVAWSVSLIVVNIARVWQVRYLIGALPFSPGMLKGVAAAGVAALAGLGAQALVPQWPWSLVVGLTVIAGSYLAVVLALGLSKEDVMVLRTLRRRRGRGRNGPPPTAGTPTAASGAAR
ncbi:flippase [Micromonospora sp. SH-82]|uniref:flippase n=1 Tax=Micromonospora sp. SH-82 TaxID=3132938 RepID=UPI003EB760D3